MKPVFIIILIAIIVCIILSTMSIQSTFFSAAKPISEIGGKPRGKGQPGRVRGKQPTCPQGYVPIQNGCKLQSSVPPTYAPSKPVPSGSSPWDVAIAASQQSQSQQSQQKPGSNSNPTPSLKCRTGFVAYNNQCIALTPVTTTGLGLNKPRPSGSGGGSGSGSGGLGVNTTGCGNGFISQNGVCVPVQPVTGGGNTGLGVDVGYQPPKPQPPKPQPQLPQPQPQPQRPQLPQQCTNGQISVNGKCYSKANMAGAVFVATALQDDMKKGTTWTQIMSKYPEIANLPKAELDNLHRLVVGARTVDHDENGKPITNRSLFDGMI